MKNINFGCGLSVAHGWENYDASPTLRLQRIPVFGHLARSLIQPNFPPQVMFGDIVRGLPVPAGAVDRVYCSHVLEHLALDDFRKSLAEVFRILRPGGIFRGVLPDLEQEAKTYLADPAHDACNQFMLSTYLGVPSRSRGMGGLVRSFFGNSHHLWMWDYKGISAEIANAGFLNVRRAKFGDSEFDEFKAVEDPDRWKNCLGFECKK
jgi:SAM-dependent methyltransferase